MHDAIVRMGVATALWPRRTRRDSVTSSPDRFSGDTDLYIRPTMRPLNTKIAGKVFRAAQYV